MVTPCHFRVCKAEIALHYFTVLNKINAMVKKLQFIVDLEQSRVTSFSSLESFVMENELKIHANLIEDIKKHIALS